MYTSNIRFSNQSVSDVSVSFNSLVVSPQGVKDDNSATKRLSPNGADKAAPNIGDTLLSFFGRFEDSVGALLDEAITGTQKVVKKTSRLASSIGCNEGGVAVTESTALHVSAWGSANIDGVSFNNCVRILIGSKAHALEIRREGVNECLLCLPKKGLHIVKPMPKGLMKSKRAVAISNEHFVLLFDDLANEIL